MPIGTVLRYERNSGFGFIRSENGQEIFRPSYRASRTAKYLAAGQEVRFNIEQGERGPRAVGVTVTRDVSLKQPSPARLARPPGQGALAPAICR